ncbi:MAG: efflux RND transporter periplasmic adaptor subunit, partial [Nitrospirota bacterium]
NLISQSEKDTAQTNFDSDLAALNAAQARIKEEQAAERLARLNLENIVITSPIDGIVISRNVEIGQTVAASLQAPTLFTIANDLSEMVIDTNVDEADIGRIEVGQPASMTVDTYPQDPFKGVVLKIYNQPTISQNVVTYNVVINVKNQGLKLRPGMTANVTIIIGQKDNVLKIPNAALRFRPPDLKERVEGPSIHPLSTIWILENDILMPARVKLGISDGQHSEIISGDVKEGQEIAIDINKSTGSSKRPAAFRFY